MRERVPLGGCLVHGVGIESYFPGEFSVMNCVRDPRQERFSLVTRPAVLMPVRTRGWPLGSAWWAPNGFAAIPTTALDPLQCGFSRAPRVRVPHHRPRSRLNLT